MELTRGYPAVESDGLLYPMMVIAAVAVIVFSIAGIATIGGWMPNAMRGVDVITDGPTPQSHGAATLPDGPQTAPAFQCVECGVIESIREIERGGSLWSVPVAQIRRVDTAHAL